MTLEYSSSFHGIFPFSPSRPFEPMVANEGTWCFGGFVWGLGEAGPVCLGPALDLLSGAEGACPPVALGETVSDDPFPFYHFDHYLDSSVEAPTSSTNSSFDYNALFDMPPSPARSVSPKTPVAPRASSGAAAVGTTGSASPHPASPPAPWAGGAKPGYMLDGLVEVWKTCSRCESGGKPCTPPEDGKSKKLKCGECTQAGQTCSTSKSKSLGVVLVELRTDEIDDDSGRAVVPPRRARDHSAEGRDPAEVGAEGPRAYGEARARRRRRRRRFA